MPKTNAIQKMQQISESKGSDVERHLLALDGDFEGVVLHSQVLCMTYIDSAVTEGGIIKPPNAVEEDRFQGKIFLVLEMGPGAFVDDKIAQFHGVKPMKHTWVMARATFTEGLNHGRGRRRNRCDDRG
jgi:hypothetical protein